MSACTHGPVCCYILLIHSPEHALQCMHGHQLGLVLGVLVGAAYLWLAGYMHECMVPLVANRGSALPTA